MEFFEVINKRRTVRDFSDKIVPDNIIKKLLEAGMRAPSNDHLRNWEFVVMKGHENIERILKDIKNNAELQMETVKKLTLKESQKNMYYDSVPKQYKMLIESGCLILPFYKQKGELLTPINLSSLNAFASIWCVIENIILAATAEGLACAIRIPIGNEMKDVSEIVKAPEGYVMPCFISIGYEKENASIVKQEKFNIDDKIHYNLW